MMRFGIAIISAILAVACGAQPPGIAIDNARYREPLVEGGAGVAYFSITSVADDRIIGVSSRQALAVEVHETIASGGMASMQKRESVDLPAGKTVIFDAGGLHLMVIGAQPLAPGATFPIQIELESGREETVAFVLTPPAS